MLIMHQSLKVWNLYTSLQKGLNIWLGLWVKLLNFSTYPNYKKKKKKNAMHYLFRCLTNNKIGVLYKL